jgi:hypothetical protein
VNELLQRIRERAADPEFNKEKMRKEARCVVQEVLKVTDEYFFSHGGGEMSWVKMGMGVGFDEAKNQLLPLIEALIQVVEKADEALRLCSDRYEQGTYLGNVKVARMAAKELHAILEAETKEIK